MPIYEYRCRDCGAVIEVMQKQGDRRLRKCRVCSGRLEKLISRTSFQLRGRGWFADGYTDNSKPPDSGEKKPKDTAADSKPSDSKSKKKGSAGGSD